MKYVIDGMTKREDFAKSIMAGFAAAPEENTIFGGPTLEKAVKNTAEMAVYWADALIDALNKPLGD